MIVTPTELLFVAVPPPLAVATLRAGDAVDVGGYHLTFKGMRQTDSPHVASMLAEIDVARDGRSIATMYPEKRLYKRQQQPTTEIALRTTWREDLYLVLGSWDDASGLMTLQVFINPLVVWLWIGGITMVLGTVIVMAPTAAEQRALAAALAVEDRGLAAWNG